jgi:plastocyanin
MNPENSTENQVGQSSHLVTIAVVLILIVSGVGGYLYLMPDQFGMFQEKSDPMPETVSEAIRIGAAPIPEFTEAVVEKLAASKGFQALISYSDSGFEPNRAEVAKGETVRFTNNSSQDLWVVSVGEGTGKYPRTKEACGESDLDSCVALAPRDFWEFTFAKAGEWDIINKSDPTKVGKVLVK